MDCDLKVKSFEHLVFECTSNLLTCKLGGNNEKNNNDSQHFI